MQRLGERQDDRMTAQAHELDELRAMVAQLTTQIGALQGQRSQDDTPPRGALTGMPGLKANEPPVRGRVVASSEHDLQRHDVSDSAHKNLVVAESSA